MSEQQYWDKDPMLAKYYRQADDIRMERVNQQLWLQGMYVYEAIADVAPVLHAFAKKGTRIRPYPSQPYPLSEKQKKKHEHNDEKASYEQIKAHMDRFMTQHNAKFQKKEGGGVNGNT